MTASTKKTARRPFNSLKFMEILLGIGLIAIIGSLLLGFFPLSHPSLTKKFVERAKQQGLDSCSIENVTVAIWKGVSFHGVSFSCKSPTGDCYRAKAPVITLKCNLFMLATKYPKIKKIVTTEFKGLTAGGRNDPAMLVQSILRVVGSSRYIKGAAISSTDMTIEKGGAFSLQGKGIGLDVIFSEEGTNRFKGFIAADELAWSHKEVARQVSGDFSYDDGTISIARCKAKMFDGRMKLESRINLEKHTLTNFVFSIADLDLSNWSSFSDTNHGRLSGKADVRFEIDSTSLLADSLKGKGTVSVSRFEIVKFPFQRSLVTMLMYPGLAHLNFKKFRANLKLKPGKLLETDATGDGDTLSVKADGWIRTDGLLNEKLECTLTRAGVATLPDFAQKTLEDAPGGGRVLKCRVYGMIQNPKVSVESKVILQKAVTNMFEEVKNNLQLWMR